MKTKTLLLISLVLNAGLIGGLGFLAKQNPAVTGNPVLLPKVSRLVVSPAQPLGQTSFSPVYEAVLPLTSEGQKLQLFDLEEGILIPEPDLETFGMNSKAALKWLFATGVDLGCIGGPETLPCCITFYMAMAPCSPDAWTSATAGEMLGSDDLLRISDPKRNCIIPKEGSGCYKFRTHDGAIGMMVITPGKDSFRIRYKFALSHSPEMVARGL